MSIEDYNGLTNKEVEQLKKQGLTNDIDDPNEQTMTSIIISNVCTFFNLIIFILALLVFSSGQLKNLMFVGVALCNLAIGVFQEIKAKVTLDKLSLIAETKVEVIRDGKIEKISHKDLVLGDYFLLKTGNQIVTDSTIIEGYLEVNESLLTGEPDIIEKRPGDQIYSGTFIISGQAIGKAVHVGEDNISNKIAIAAKMKKKQKSVLQDSINKILKLVSILIVPLGLALFISQYFIKDLGYTRSIIGTVASVSGMIPEGLVLLTSVALAIGAINLAKQETLIHDLFCIETLAHVDVLCLDKTGTLTAGKMSVDQVIELNDSITSQQIMPQLLAILNDDNATSQALKAYYGTKEDNNYTKIIHFSSERKYSGVCFNETTYLFGAPEFLFKKHFNHIQPKIEKYTKEGKRVLLLAKTKNENLDTLEIISFIIISDIIRENAKTTLEYFKHQGVDIRIISGDHPSTVSLIAKKTGLEDYNSFIDASTLKTEEQIAEASKKYKIFGRVSPLQKRQIIEALQKQGHTVGMTGDGVNDVMALKAADCSIAMAEGSDAAKEISNIVLLDSDFAHLPSVLGEGRKVIHHIQNASSLFLVKTIFSIILTFMTVCIGFAYPFKPIQLTFVSSVAVGIPSLFLTFEKDYTIIQGDFFINVLSKALPGALAVFIEVSLVTIYTQLFGYNLDVRSTMCVILTALCTMLVQKEIYPLTTHYRRIIFTTLSVLAVVGFLLFHRFFELVKLDMQCTLVSIALGALAFLLIKLMHIISSYILKKASPH